MKVAIIGGGASGLGAAMFLHGVDGIECTVYEKADYFGGNVFSAYTGSQSFAQPFGDLGVNDFNQSTYRLFNSVLDLLKEAGYPVRTEKLLDTTLFFTGKGQQPALFYTYAQMEESTDGLLGQIRKDWKLFSLTIKDNLKDPEIRAMTVDEFCNQVGQDGQRRYSELFCNYNLKPRINGMYYTNGENPGNMSINGVMMYYALQENISNPSAGNTRLYFTDGASSWIRAAVQYLQDRGAGLVKNTAVQVRRLSGRWQVFRQDGQTDVYDVVISALPADQLYAVFGPSLPTEVSKIAGWVRYLSSTSYFHTDPSVLWVDRADWSTYNISIQNPAQMTDRPYVITYVSKMHQGHDDAAPPFVSVDPKDLDPAKIKTMFATPSSNEKAPAKKTLRHNTLFPINIHDQQELHKLQGADGLYFTSGWTAGAGLHEEVLLQSLYISWLIVQNPKPHLSPIFNPDIPDHIPPHILGLDPDYEPEEPFGPDHPLRRGKVG